MDILPMVKSAFLNLHSVYIKILTTHFQIMSVIQALKFEVPSSVIAEKVGNPIESAVANLDCLFVGISKEAILLPYFRIIFSIILPIVYYFLVALCFSLLATKIYNTKAKYTLISAFIFSYLFF